MWGHNPKKRYPYPARRLKINRLGFTMTLACPKGEFWHRLERVLDLSKKVLDPVKRDFGNSLFTPRCIKGSFLARDSPDKKPINGLRKGIPKIRHVLYLVDITGIIAYWFFSCLPRLSRSSGRWYWGRCETLYWVGMRSYSSADRGNPFATPNSAHTLHKKL